MNVLRMAEPDTTPHQSGEWELLAQVLAQAIRDLAPRMAPHVRLEAARFFRNERGDLTWLCELLDVDVGMLQRRIMQDYPEVGLPQQLELTL
jgi:hypothetical protein